MEKARCSELLLGELRPSVGHVRLGTQLQIAYFDQERMQLDPDRSVRDNVADGTDRIQIGEKSRHVVGYLRDFLFPPERVNSPVQTLSGGERNRLLLAKLFARPANLLVLDEPTNDLDVETLELLEELLTAFDGTLLLVSHDRAFLDQTVTSTLVLEGRGQVGEYVGGYSDWKRQTDGSGSLTSRQTRATNKPASHRNLPGGQAKLSFKDQRELETLPALIEHAGGQAGRTDGGHRRSRFLPTGPGTASPPRLKSLADVSSGTGGGVRPVDRAGRRKSRQLGRHHSDISKR